MEVFNAEMEMDRQEGEQFRKASCIERTFLFWKQAFDVKKWCLMSLVLFLILAIQIMSLLAQTEFSVVISELARRGREYYMPGGNGTSVTNDSVEATTTNAG